MRFFCQAEDGIRDLVRSRGLGDVYKRQDPGYPSDLEVGYFQSSKIEQQGFEEQVEALRRGDCLLYTSDAADERSSVDLGGRRIIKKKKQRGTQEDGRSKTKKHKTTRVKTGRSTRQQ